ncbi:RNA polymerase sigma factor [Sphingobacterium corticibacterium]|uniref:Sigma-70 family RNA polymerase sigma factor n=1 Tax=Sphingobacterium corticibacterium TaxID=2484746 RepID=A0A4Q6XR75_9SPHI|nr:sigma-70 family RNA polymerase sigma factor [Sphingobacterium corticibacterium]RZF62245.1 sigma-70 family RNA polymerase sigma factor [Sphingobacterium corticibacterium]
MKNDIGYFQDFKNGRESALKYLMTRYGKELRFFAHSIIRNKEIAEEIVSDAFFKLWQRRDKVVKESNIKAFLFITTRNACYDYLDSPQYRRYSDVEIEEEMAMADDDVMTRIIRVELIQLVIAELEKLPEQQAAIFKMTYLEGLNVDEICAQLHTTQSNVYFARSKAISTLKQIFKSKNVLVYVFFCCLVCQ